MPDIFSGFQAGLSSPIESAEAITLANQTFANVSRAIHLSTAGTLNLVLKDGSNRTMILEAGWHPIRAIGILASGSANAVGHACW